MNALLQLASLLLLGASTTTFIYVMITQPLLEPPQHGLRGLKRARARSGEDGFGDLELPMRWLGARLAPLMSERSKAELAHRITIAGELWGLWPAEMKALTLLGLATGLALGVVCTLCFGEVWYTFLGGVVGGMWPGLWLTSTGTSRLRGIQRRVPHVVDLLVLSLGAGLDFPAALRQVVERAPQPEAPVIEELGLVLEELKLGRTRRQAFERFALRAPCDEVRDLVSAAIQSEEQGTPLGTVLATQATTSRQRRSTRAEETASKTSTAMVLPTVLLFAALMIMIVAPMAFQTSQASTQMMR